MSYCTWNSVSWQISSMRKSLGQREGLALADLLTPEMLQEVARLLVWLSLLRSIWDQLLENEILPADGWADATISCVGTNRRGPTGWIKKPTTRCRTNWNSAAKHRRWRAWNTTNSPIGSASKEHSRHSTPFSPPSCSHPHARTKSTDAS